jgi:hypothetical protein
MADRIESAIICLVLTAIGLVLVAPLLGRYGAAYTADVAMGAAAAAGVGAFVAATLETLRAARRARHEDGEQR